ncbi:MAG: glutamate--tRNA ligase family protein, partial [Pseudomonadota bacterium]|nr:glutamate--tRNA ligase family protein [Pseudomonadota bacterium]
CRAGLQAKSARAVRLRCTAALPEGARSLRIDWGDRRLGLQHQDVARAVGDFVLKRADGLWAYQLAVVVDDADQGVTHVVRGEDLADNTPRQIHLQRVLGLPTPRYLHTPLVLNADGTKLSKQTGAAPVGVESPLAALRKAAQALDLAPGGDDRSAWLADATRQWRRRWIPSVEDDRDTLCLTPTSRSP